MCARCNKPRFSVAGCKFVYIGLFKRRICSECVATEKEKKRAKDAVSKEES